MSDKLRSPRQSFKVLLDPNLMAEANEVGINISAACEAGIAQRITEARQWKAEHKGTIESWNEWVDRHGLPLAKYRMF